MKKSITTVLALLIAVSCFSGCKKEKDDDLRDYGNTQATTGEVTDVQASGVITEATTEATTIETTTAKVDKDDDAELKSMREFFKSFLAYDKYTGYVAESSKVVEETFKTNSEFSLYNLSDGYAGGSFINDEHNKSIYRVDVVNYTAPDLIDGIYLSTLTMPNDDNQYYIAYGEEKSTSQKEVEEYAFLQEVVTYYAIIEPIDDDIYMVFPLIGGNDSLGYWAVLPVLTEMGFDTKGVQSLAHDNSSYSVSNMTLILDQVQYLDEESYGVATFINNNDIPIYLDDYQVTLNGVDVTDDFSTFIACPANDTYVSNFFFDGFIYSGDVLVVSCMVLEDDVFTELGRVEFTFNFDYIA